MSKFKIKKLKKSLVGEYIPMGPKQGHAAEAILRSIGMPPAPGKGPDYPTVNAELKSKNVKSKSANVVGTMSRTDIINTPYEMSSIHDKIQTQIRLKIENNIVISDEVFDFSPECCQELIKKAYEEGRTLLNDPDPPDYVNCARYGYFEKKRETKDSYMFRINVKPMQELENLSKTTFKNLFV